MLITLLSLVQKSDLITLAYHGVYISHKLNNIYTIPCTQILPKCHHIWREGERYPCHQQDLPPPPTWDQAAMCLLLHPPQPLPQLNLCLMVLLLRSNKLSMRTGRECAPSQLPHAKTGCTRIPHQLHNKPAPCSGPQMTYRMSETSFPSFTLLFLGNRKETVTTFLDVNSITKYM